MTNFSAYAAYYDALNAEKDYESEAQFVGEILDQYCGSAAQILELGCGTGQHALQLAKLGYEVHGTDLSGAMLQMAQNSLGKAPADLRSRLVFEQGDLRDLRLERKFDAVIALFHVMSYQLTDSEWDRAFQTAAYHLNPGGIFVFDYWYGPAVEHQGAEKRVRIYETEQHTIRRTAIPKTGFQKNVVSVVFEVDVVDRSGGKAEAFKEEHNMRYLFENEIADFAERANFRVLRNKEWLVEVNPSKDSWSVYTLAQFNG